MFALHLLEEKSIWTDPSVKAGLYLPTHCEDITYLFGSEGCGQRHQVHQGVWVRSHPDGDHASP